MLRPAILLLALAASADDRVDRAIAKLRRGDPAATGELVRLGPPAARAVEPLLTNLNEEVRRGAVAVLSALPGPESCRALGAALADASWEIRGRAALAFYHECAKERVACDRLMAGISKGDPSAAAVLLAGYCPEAARSFLEGPLSGRMKLEPYGPVVPAALVASVGRLRAGDSTQARVVAGAAAGKALNETEFIVQVLPVIPLEHLASILPVLDDPRDAKALAGAPAGATPRRVCDAAVDAFAARLEMTLPFERKPSGRYTEDQLQAARAAIREKLPAR